MTTGRPKKPTGETRDKPLRIRLTPAERAEIDEAAKAKGLDTSAWARSELLNLRAKGEARGKQDLSRRPGVKMGRVKDVSPSRDQHRPRCRPLPVLTRNRCRMNAMIRRFKMRSCRRESAQPRQRRVLIAPPFDGGHPDRSAYPGKVRRCDRDKPSEDDSSPWGPVPQGPRRLYQVDHSSSSVSSSPNRLPSSWLSKSSDCCLSRQRPRPTRSNRSGDRSIAE